MEVSPDVKETIDRLIALFLKDENSTEVSPEFEAHWEAIDKDSVDKTKQKWFKYLDTLTANDLKSKFAYILSGHLNHFFSNMHAAIAAYTKATEIDDQFKKAYYNLGYLYYDMNEYQKAIDAYQKAIEIDDQNSSVYNNLGNAYLNIKEYQKAIDAYQKAIDIDDRNRHAFNGLGNAYFHIKEYKKAIDSYLSAVSLNLDPLFEIVRSNIGLFYLDLAMNYEPSTLQKVYEIENNAGLSAYAFDTFSNFSSQVKNFTIATLWFKKCLGTNPSYSNAHYGLSRCWEEKGNLVVARQRMLTAYFLNKEKQANNLLHFLSRNFLEAPLLVQQILTDVPTISIGEKDSTYVNDSMVESKQMQHISHWQIINGNEKMSLFLRYQAVLQYLHGNVIGFYELVNSSAYEAFKNDFQLLYYNIRTHTDIILNDDPLVEHFHEIVQELNVSLEKEKHTIELFTKAYYAALIHELCGEENDALSILDKIAQDFTPAAYLSLKISHDQNDMKACEKKAELIIQREKRAKALNFHKPLVPLTTLIKYENLDDMLAKIDLSKDTSAFKTWFFHVVHYTELEEPIHQFQLYARNHLKNSVEIESTTKIKKLSDYFRLPRILKEEIEMNWQRFLSERIGKAFLNSWSEHVLSELKDKHSATSLNEQIEETQIDHLVKFNTLKDMSASTKRIDQIGKLIENREFPVDTTFKLLAYFYVSNHLDDDDFLLLYTYLILKNRRRLKSTQELDIGIIDSIKVSFETLSREIITTGSTASVVTGEIIYSFSIATSAVLVINLGKKIITDIQDSQPFSHYKKDFLVAINNEMEKLGKEKFEKKYGTNRFAKWLE